MKRTAATSPLKPFILQTSLLSDAACSSASATLPPWQRQLYKSQPYADNYVPPDFLAHLPFLDLHKQRNTPLQHTLPHPSLSLYQLVVKALVVQSRLTLVSWFLTVFAMLYSEKMSVRQLMIIDLVTVIMLYSLYLLYDTDSALYRCWKTLDSLLRFLLLSLLLLLLTPILSTLTSSYDSDTIWSLTCFLCTLHILTHEYRVQVVKHNELTSVTSPFSAFSLNAVQFASVLLASRLQAATQVYVLLFFSHVCFTGVTVVVHRLMTRDRKLLNSLTGVMSVGLVCVLYKTQPLLFTLCYLILTLLITIIGPLSIVRLQSHRQRISGGWDYDADNEIESDNL